MTARRATFGVLGLAALVLVFLGGQRAASQDFETPSAEPIPVGRTPAYIVVDFVAGGGADFITNPRAADGQVFYVTDILPDDVHVRFPELADAPLWSGGVGTPGLTLTTPVPFMTTAWVNKSAVLCGYWSTRQPDIEVVQSAPIP